MARMILACGACSAQNFVSVERRAARHAPPPRCWKCGELLEFPVETGEGTGESKKDGLRPSSSGGEGDA